MKISEVQDIDGFSMVMQCQPESGVSNRNRNLE